MARVGETIDNPLMGETITFRETGKETNGACLQFDLTVQPHGGVRFEHIHPRQSEGFRVVAGTVTLTVAGERRLVGPGEQFTVAAGVRHIFVNDGDEVLRAVIAVRPALATGELLEILFRGTRDGIFKNSTPGLLQLAAFDRSYRVALPYLTAYPIVLQRLALPLLSPLARLLGHQATYPKYVEL